MLGDEITNDSAVVICNHYSLADHIVIAFLARYANRNDSNDEMKSNTDLSLPRVNFFSWFMIWKLPSLRILCNMAKCDENWELDNSLLEPVFEEIQRSKFPEWIVVFPEVNIWTKDDADLQKQQCEKFYLPQLQNVLYPRFSGFYNVITALSSKNNFKFSKLYDTTIVYQYDNQGASPSLVEIFASEIPITITVHIKSKILSRVPIKRSKVERYLEHSWVEKDRLLLQLVESDTMEVELVPILSSLATPLLSSLIGT